MLRAWCQRLVHFLRTGRLLPWLPVLAGLAVFLLESEASGRAGGGQHYSGGGSRSSGGSYSGGSSRSFSSGGGSHSSGGDGGAALFQLIYWIFRLTFNYPLVMVPLWLVLGFVIYRQVQAMPSRATPREIDDLERRRLVPRQDVDSTLANLRSRDPNFNGDAFFERSKKVFLDIQEAWFLRDLEPVRVYMSDGLYRRFTTLLDLMTLQNQRNGLADAKVISARIVEVTQTEAFDCLTVRIHASLRDVDTPAYFTDEQTRQAALRAQPQQFSELWTFVRRRDAKSKPGYDAAQGKCPNCGAPFTGGAANKCEYCGAIVNSGAYDWVLAEITQESEYLPHDPSTPGFAAMLAKDPDAAPEILRDRGLLLFWKWLEAWARMDASKMRKLATPNGLSAIVQEIEAARARGDEVVVKLPAVGGTAVAAIETDVDGYDRVHIDVRWSALMATKKTAPGKPTRPYRSVLTMVRAAGAKTDRGVGLANERCGSCRAPLTNSDSSTCDFCGHDLSTAATEWQLESLVPYELWRRPAKVTRTTDGNAFAVASERKRLMQVMVAIVKADGVVDNSELKLLKQCSTRWRVPWEEVEALLASADEEELLSGLRPSSTTQAREFIQTLIAAAKVDGRVDRRERMLIYRAGTKLHLNQAELDELIARG